MATAAKKTPASPAPAADAKPVSSKLPPGFKLPKTLGACADLLYKTQLERYALNKQAEALEAVEGAIKNHIIMQLPKSDATGVAGKSARVYVENKTVVKITDFKAYVADVVARMKKDPGALAMLQKRVGESAVKEIWEAGKKVKGVEPLDVPVVRMNKV